MRERVEDLGRILVLIDNLLESEIFTFYQGRTKDFVEHFEDLSSDAKEETLRTVIYGIKNLQDSLCKISEIARGEDFLNQSDI